MDKADEAVAKWLTSTDHKQGDDHPILCGGCGGWPIDDGAIFVQVLAIVGGKREHGWMCELCYLNKLHRRARFNNISSGPTFQINLPEIGVRKEPDPRKVWEERERRQRKEFEERMRRHRIRG